MKLGKLAVLFLFLTGTLMPCFPAAATEPAKTMKVHVTNYPVVVTLLPAGDEDGHVLGTARREGQAVIDDGETAKYSTVFGFDTHRGKGGSSQGYTRFEFADGSRIIISWTATVIFDKTGASSSEGQGTIAAGIGRFEGVKGACTFTAKEEKTGAIVADATVTYTH